MSCFLLYYRGFNLRFVRLISTTPRPEASRDKQKIIILNKRYKRELWRDEGTSMATFNLMINFRFNACLFDMSRSSRLGQRGWPRYCNCFSDVIGLLFRPLNLMVPVFKMIFFYFFCQWYIDICSVIRKVTIQKYLSCNDLYCMFTLPFLEFSQSLSDNKRAENIENSK